MMERIGRVLVSLLWGIWQVLLALLLVFPYLLLRLLKALAEILAVFSGREANEPEQREPCFEIPEHIRRKPDPCLYSQEFILANYPGVPVTWNNPDIWVTELNGTAVDVHQLQPNHDYLVHGRISNASFDPAIGTMVSCAYRAFGFSTPGETPVELNSDGTEKFVTLHIGAWQSEIAIFTWRTPNQTGHYCLLVRCSHIDDAQFGNNKGQHNADVVAGEPGTPIIETAPLTNFNLNGPQQFWISADTYEIPSIQIDLKLDTLVQSFARGHVSLDREESTVRIGQLRAWQRGLERLGSPSTRSPTYVGYAYRGLDTILEQNSTAPRNIPSGWMIDADDQPLGEPLTLGPGETRAVRLRITPPPGAQPGSRIRFNFTAFDRWGLPVGGVSITIQMKG